LIPEEAAKLIGKTDAPVVFEVERGAIKKYADAVDDRNPLYWDEEYACNSRYGSLIAPPGFFGWPVTWTGAGPFDIKDSVGNLALEAMSKAGLPFILDGGAEFEFFLPVRAGDILINSSKLLDINERESKGTRMFFCIMENTFTNQNGAIALKVRQTIICR
jgi:acyl dehydratase